MFCDMAVNMNTEYLPPIRNNSTLEVTPPYTNYKSKFSSNAVM